MKLKVFESFAGYGSQAMALNRLKVNYPGFDYEVVGISEIDKYALQAYKAVHDHCPNYGSISEIDWDTVPYFDLFTYSFPCTDISNAGQQKGFSKGSGTRSSLLWECQRAIEIKRPKYLLMENVSALVSQKFLPSFREWIELIGSYGYSSFVSVLNAKDYGVPQNRERVFLVSILGDCQYHFPAPFKLAKRLKDILEDNVDKKYYLSDKMVEYLNNRTEIAKQRGNGFRFNPTDGGSIAKSITTHAGDRIVDNFILEIMEEPRVMQIGNIYPDTDKFKNRTMGRIYDTDGLSPTINSCGGEDREPKILQVGRGFNKGAIKETSPTITSNSFECNNFVIGSMQRNAYKGNIDGVSPTITAACGMAGGQTPIIGNQYCIRKLTPRECFRLMDVSEADINKLLNAGISNTQLYKLAGNSIVVNVLYHIFRKMFINTQNENRQLTLF